HALAMFCSETGDFSKAANAERQYASSKDADPGAAASAAELSLRAGDAELAVRWATTALERAGTAPMHHLLGQAYAAANRPDDALREFHAAGGGGPSTEAF